MLHPLDTTKALHTWSLFRTLGRFVATGSAPSGRLPENPGADGVTVLDLPAQLAARGFTSAQLCHFYLPRTDSSYLEEVRSAFADASVQIECFLLDDGDPLDPISPTSGLDWMSSWIEVAQSLGCERVRVPAGDRSPTADLLDLSARGLRSLAQRHPDIRVLTENWLTLLPDARWTRDLLDRLGDEVGLLIDTGNWDGADKYEQIRSVAGSAEASQVKARELPDGRLDAEDFRRSLQSLREAGFGGRLSLVYAGADDHEWDRLDELHALIRQGGEEHASAGNGH